MTPTLTVSDDVRTLAPGFTCLAVEARGLVNGESNEESSALLDDATRRLVERLDGRAPHENPHVAAWRDTYTAFGAKPSRTRNSAEALAGRALTDAGLPRINLLVDLYNAISVAHLIPVGGEDTDRIKGAMRLVRSTGQEPFRTVAGGEEAVEHPEPGEVVWCDDEGVTCRAVELAAGRTHPAHRGVRQCLVPAGEPRPHDDRRARSRRRRTRRIAGEAQPRSADHRPHPGVTFQPWP